MNKKSYLPADSQPWARAIEQEVNDTSELIRLNKINSDNELHQINSTISLLTRNKNELIVQQSNLQAQQNYLNTLNTYSTSSPNTVTVNGNNNGTYVGLKNIATGLFYVSRPATVLLSASCDVFTSSHPDYSANLAITQYSSSNMSNIIYYNSIDFNRQTDEFGNFVYTGSLNSDNRHEYIFKLASPGWVFGQMSITTYMPGIGQYVTASNALLSISVII